MTPETRIDGQDSALERVFADARAAAPLPSAALLARIETDALREQKGRVRTVPPVARRRQSVVGRFLDLLGGPRLAAGLATATLVGLWIGWVQPAPLAGLTDRLDDRLSGLSAPESIELIPALDPFAAEG